MSAIDDLISQIDNPELRQRIQQEVASIITNDDLDKLFEQFGEE